MTWIGNLSSCAFRSRSVGLTWFELPNHVMYNSMQSCAVMLRVIHVVCVKGHWTSVNVKGAIMHLEQPHHREHVTTTPPNYFQACKHVVRWVCAIFIRYWAASTHRKSGSIYVEPSSFTAMIAFAKHMTEVATWSVIRIVTAIILKTISIKIMNASHACHLMSQRCFS